MTFLQPATTRVETDVTIGVDTTIGPGVSLLGLTRVGAGCEIGPHTTLQDASVGGGAIVKQAFVVEAEIGPSATIGPFSYLRPGTVVGEGQGSAASSRSRTPRSVREQGPHLSYIGDADVGEQANLGASTITANYDGRKKHRTKIGKSAKTGVHTSWWPPWTSAIGRTLGPDRSSRATSPRERSGLPGAKENVEGYADRVEEDPQ